MANYLIMPYAKISQDPTPGSPMFGLSVGPTLLFISTVTTLKHHASNTSYESSKPGPQTKNRADVDTNLE
ncbi:hypothetical protein PoB_003599800 [Plakobranchus ocellatus]|uniref:Uncharacterized protein n=1 Tax=Plakobranchus ocellatus TaxID=259542 RepID=A0AAV4ASE7_9GAST|nr:hypothetical protein PoB_003599800 [Plakobranchus ocellatus]